MADVDVVTPVINELIEDGQKVMTFSSSDAAKEDGATELHMWVIRIIMKMVLSLQRLCVKSLDILERLLS